MQSWSLTSWQDKVALQQPEYPDQAGLARVVGELGLLPPLVSSAEIESLKSQLASAARGERFLLQGGDCAERFDECQAHIIASKLKIILQMSLVLVHGLRQPIIRVGRIAGQYAKPRTSESETRDSISLPAYRGEIVNDAEFTKAARTPDPNRLLRGYERAALTLNFIRALIDGGFADLHHPEYWNLKFAQQSPAAADYQRIVESISHSQDFLRVLDQDHEHELMREDFYTSHEGLHLLYEQAQTRQVPRREGWYNLSTHFPWIGMRTATPVNNAHVEYFRGIRNPIAVKIGPETAPAEIVKLVEILHPVNEPGRLTLIHRFGAEKIERCLPQLVQAVQSTGKTVLWCCDPMHGNTRSVTIDVDEREPMAMTSSVAKTAAIASVPVTTLKTRRFEDIASEVQQAFEIHRRMKSRLGGVHIELTGENVTECTGGPGNTTSADLTRAYTSQVDPRLNYEQSLELALLIARMAR